MSINDETLASIIMGNEDSILQLYKKKLYFCIYNYSLLTVNCLTDLVESDISVRLGYVDGLHNHFEEA